MEAKLRRDKLKNILEQSIKPVTGSVLSKELGVSRQIIVGDIAILRAAGMQIYATPDGYMTPPPEKKNEEVTVFACRHDKEALAQELEIIIDNGGKVLNVIVEHPVYGEIKVDLMLSSRRQLAGFLEKLEASGARPLSSVTDGVHLHTVSAPSLAVLQQIAAELNDKGFLAADWRGWE